MDTGGELVSIKNGVGLFYEYSAGETGDSIGIKEIPLDTFKGRQYACRNFTNDIDCATLNGRKFSSIEAMIDYAKSVEDADIKREEHTKNGWYFL